MGVVSEHPPPGEVGGRVRRHPQLAPRQQPAAQPVVEPAGQPEHGVTLGHRPIVPSATDSAPLPERPPPHRDNRGDGSEIMVILRNAHGAVGV